VAGTEHDAIYATARQGIRARLAGRLGARFRRGRFELFRETIAPGGEETIVDIGCGAIGLAAFGLDNPITGVDRVDRPEYPGRFVRADARELPFDDGEFDIAYSNSLVEHLDPADRARFAAEVRRVARRYFVQTPNRRFPIEPHALLPLVQFLPVGLRRRVWRLGVAKGEFEDIRLLDSRELQMLFPDAEILRERVGPLTKSLIAVGGAGRLAPTRRPSRG
jgi:hypothetical protein